jgi:hypothetical protein
MTNEDVGRRLREWAAYDTTAAEALQRIENYKLTHDPKIRHWRDQVGPCKYACEYTEVLREVTCGPCKQWIYNQLGCV